MSDLVKQEQSLQKLVQKLPKNEIAICEALNEFNQLRSFKLNLAEVLQWKDTILRLMPKVEPEAVSFVVDQLILGKLEYNKDHGIQNLIENLKRTKKTDKGYILNTMTW